MASSPPAGRSATWHVLTAGYVGDRVAGTVSYVRDGDLHLVIDPGMVASRSAILDPLRALGVTPEHVTDVVLSHHHPDHTVNVALFPDANVHDMQATYRDDVWTQRPAEGFALSESVLLWATPGHTPQDVTTLVGSPDGLAAFTHAWWHSEGPAEDPYAPDRDLLRTSRERILAVATTVVPGHGTPFTPGDGTPR